MKKMKKAAALMMAIAMVCGALVGCGGSCRQHSGFSRKSDNM